MWNVLVMLCFEVVMNVLGMVWVLLVISLSGISL